MSFKASQGNNQIYNNADSFAMAFDEAWKDYPTKFGQSPTSREEKLKMILIEIENHPFIKEHPLKAKKVAEFRLRLLNLD